MLALCKSTIIQYKIAYFISCINTYGNFLGGSGGKESASGAGDLVRSLGQKSPLEKEMATHCSILAWEIHGQKSLAGYSPWGWKKSDTTKQLLLHLINS